jgi:tetratricopeptide (TPR) repeat protein
MMSATRTLGTFVWNTFRGQHAVLLTVVAAISLSLVFVPRGAELGLLNLKLGLPHQALAILEERYSAGDSSAATVGALAQARAQVGDLPGAVSLLEQLLGEYQQDPSLLQALAGYYRRLGRLEASLRMTERLAAIEPSEGSFQEIARLYRELGRTVEQRRVLRQLVAQSRPDPANVIELANLEKALGNPGAGIEVIKRLEAVRPAAVDASVVALDVSLRIAAGQAESAFERAERWLSRSRVPARDVLPLASVLSVLGYPTASLKLLQPLASKSRDPGLILATSQAEIDTGQREAALQRLETFAAKARGRIDPDLAHLRLRLAASMGLHVRASEAAEAMGIPAVPMDLLPATAAAALQSGRAAVAEAVRNRLRDERGTLTPVVIAETSLALGDRNAAAEWARRAAPDLVGNPELAMRLARLELNLRRKDHALEALRSGLPILNKNGQPPVMRDPLSVPTNLLTSIVGLYADLGMAREALMVLEVVKEKQPSPEADQAWALAAAMTRRQAAVIEWLKTTGDRRIGPNFLKDLVFASMKGGSAAIALAAAARLVEDRGTDSDRMLLAEVRVYFGAPLVPLKQRDAMASANRPDRTVTR